ncbi:DUF308 domain-containing protein [Nocardia sp. NPDC050712]|uniref:HdeD family acid-resistance protein n=1 Tax=Nocardia sp. NPDC050712 TaxID=3155518 RepID=UPI0033C62C49
MATTEAGVHEGPLQQLARGAWSSLLLVGVLSVVLGILMLVWPGATLVVAGALFGAYLLVSGILQLIAAFGAHVGVGWRLLSVLSGIIAIILAVLCFRNVGDSIVLLAIWIGISWLFRGVATLMSAGAEPGLPGRGWQIFFGLMLLIGGFALMIWPISSIATLTLVVGWWLIFMGIMEIIGAFQVRGRAKEVAASTVL